MRESGFRRRFRRVGVKQDVALDLLGGRSSRLDSSIVRLLRRRPDLRVGSVTYETVWLLESAELSPEEGRIPLIIVGS